LHNAANNDFNTDGNVTIQDVQYDLRNAYDTDSETYLFNFFATLLSSCIL
jgi:hypothetical protein